MIRKELENWLRSVFEMPVERYRGQVHDTGVIYYSLQRDPIQTRTHDNGMSFIYTVVVVMREPAGDDAIGWLSYRLAQNEYRIDPNFAIELDYSTENIENENMSEATISKAFNVTQTVCNDKIQERIDGLNLCLTSCEGGLRA